jgi:hypothetical protein
MAIVATTVTLEASCGAALDAVNAALDTINPTIEERGEVPDAAILALIRAQGEIEAALTALDVPRP